MRVIHMLITVAAASLVIAQDLLSFDGSGVGYLIAKPGTGPIIYCADAETTAVKRTCKDFASDFGKVVGTNGTVVTSLGSTTSPVIIAGTIGKSSTIDSLISCSKIDVAAIRGKWESYIATVVDSPVAGVQKALVIVGSDRRGTIFGMYDISERMGVSPWYWWADIPAKIKQSVYASGSKVAGPPSVKWRGIFINNESPSLTTWAANRFPKGASGSTLTDQFYARVFEMLLRSKANYMWPAMWGKMFYYDTANDGKISDDYGIVMGTSHHEPMARSELEQQKYNVGVWDWVTNKANVINFFKAGARRGLTKETLFTVGMRGSGDAANPSLDPQTLEEIVKNQQSILQSELGQQDPMKIPQAWVLYTEVGKYYQGGMKVPDSVTLLWSDDNYGNILRVPLSNETAHPAGHGVYYHFDFNGGLRCYKWINTIQLIKTWEQMHLAYEKGAKQIWITNVGDIKPLEIPTAHFLDMAYDMTKHTTPNSVLDWAKRWASDTFGPSVAEVTADILTTYGMLLMRRKYEFLSNLPFVWSTANYDEAEIVLQEWVDLLDKTQKVYDGMSASLQLPYFEMVLHPVLAGKTVIDLYIKAAQNVLYRSQNRVSTNNMANSVVQLFSQDQMIEQRWNNLFGGRWKDMVIQPHIGYTTWSEPANNIRPPISWYSSSNVPSGSIFAIAAQGAQVFLPGTALNTLYTVDPFMPALDKRWFDIFARKNGTFSYSITTNASYVKLSRTSGTINAPGTPEARIGVTVDWTAVPSGRNPVQITVNGNNERINLVLPVNKRGPPVDFSGFVETGGVVAMEVDHYESIESKNGLTYAVLPGYGRTRAGLKTWPVTSASQTANTGPKVVYSFYTFSGTTSGSLTLHLGGSINHDPSRQLKYAFSIDSGSATTIQFVPNHAMGTLPTGWDTATIAGGFSSTTANLNVPAGTHKLNIWLLEPGVVLQKVVLSIGGLRPSANGPQENVMVKPGSNPTTSSTTVAQISTATSIVPASSTTVAQISTATSTVPASSSTTGAATTTSGVKTSSTTSSQGGNTNCASKYSQCGGNGWSGPTCCVDSTCTTDGNPWYSQCL